MTAQECLAARCLEIQAALQRIESLRPALEVFFLEMAAVGRIQPEDEHAHRDPKCSAALARLDQLRQRVDLLAELLHSRAEVQPAVALAFAAASEPSP